MTQILKRTLVAAALTGLMTGSVALAKDKKEKEKEKEKKSSKKKDAAGAAADTEKQIHCLGINECKGKSECAVDGAHGCSGGNECKGKGWISVSMKECTDKNGKVVN